MTKSDLDFKLWAAFDLVLPLFVVVLIYPFFEFTCRPANGFVMFFAQGDILSVYIVLLMPLLYKTVLVGIQDMYLWFIFEIMSIIFVPLTYGVLKINYFLQTSTSEATRVFVADVGIWQTALVLSLAVMFSIFVWTVRREIGEAQA